MKKIDLNKIKKTIPTTPGKKMPGAGWYRIHQKGWHYYSQTPVGVKIMEGPCESPPKSN